MMGRHRLTIAILPPPPPSLQASGLFFSEIGHGLRCKWLIAMEFFADNRQQRGYGHLCGRRSREARSGELAGEPYDMIVRQMELIIGKTEGTILGIPHAVPCRTAGGGVPQVAPVAILTSSLRDGPCDAGLSRWAESQV
jgi:hypothetical protein